MTNYVAGKSKNQLLEDLASTGQPGSTVHEQQKAAIFVRCAEDLEASLALLVDQLHENAKASDKLGKRVFWLNVVITVATVAGAVAAAVQALK